MKITVVHKKATSPFSMIGVIGAAILVIFSEPIGEWLDKKFPLK